MKLLFIVAISSVIICEVSIIEARRTTIAPAKKLRTRWYRCNFENGYCGWKNDSTAEFQWYRTDERTPTKDTGPRWDHTKAETLRGHFLYIETSTPRVEGDRARLISPILVENGVFCLKFWHNMHGWDIGDLNVYIKGMKSKKQTTILHLSGPWSIEGVDEDNDWWNEESLEFEVKESTKIIFEGVRGTSHRGDIAIDDIELRSGRCPQRGRYMYAETSWPHSTGDRAQLQSPKISCDKGAKPVFNFWYNMNGVHAGPLRIYVKKDNGSLVKPIWETSGDHGDKWFLGQAIPSDDLVSKRDFYIIIEAEKVNYRGDVGIDDVSLAGCSKDEDLFGTLLTTPTVPAPTQTSTEADLDPSGLDCDFEHESICGWRQDSEGDVGWELNRGNTPSANTGPSSDHTTSQGWYLYVESSIPAKSDDTPAIRSHAIQPSVKSCVSFYYHMLGKDMGLLELFSVEQGTTKLGTYWYKQGEQSKNATDWRFAAVTVSHSVVYEIVFRAVRGKGFYSDIALDDIKVEPKPCNEETSAKESRHVSLSL